MKSLLAVLLLNWGFAAIADTGTPSDSCKKQREELAKIDDEISKLELDEELNQRARDLEDILRGSEDSLKAAADGAEKASEGLGDASEKIDQLAEELKPLLERMSLDVSRLTGFLGEVKAGTDQFKASLDNAKSGIGQARGFLEAAIDAANAQRGDQSLQALAKYYGQLRGALDPLVSLVPGVGAFLSVYGEAISTAANVASKLEGVVEDRNKLSQELVGIDLYQRSKSRPEKLSDLRESREELLEKMAEADCEPEDEEKAPPPPPELSERSRDACLTRNSTDENYDTDFFRARSAVRDAEADIKRKEGELAVLESDLQLARKRLENFEQAKARRERLYNQALQVATGVLGGKVRFFPPSSPEDAANKCRMQYPGEAIPENLLTAADRNRMRLRDKGKTPLPPRATDSQYLKDLCKYAEAAANPEDDRARLEANVSELEAAVADARRDLEASRKALDDLRKKRDDKQQTYDAVEKCFKDETAPFDLSGIWLDAQNQPHKLVQNGASFVLLKGRNGGGGVVLRGLVSGPANKNKALQEASYNYDYYGEISRCPDAPQFIPLTGTTFAYDTIIRGTVPHYKLDAECKRFQDDGTKKIQVNFVKERSRNT